MLKISLDPKAEKFANQIGLFLLRVVPAGVLMTFHGWDKFRHYSSMANSFPDPLDISPHISLALAIFAELFCSALVLLGIWTRLTVVPILITLAVAFFIVHGDDPMAKKELALMYLIPFVAVFFLGSGNWTIGRVFGRK
jgi:putative oxidoreductase